MGSSIHQFRYKKPSSWLPLFLSAALRPIVEASLMHKLTSPYSLYLPPCPCNSYLQSICLCGYHSTACVLSSCLLPPFPFVSFSLYLFSHLFSLFTVHLLPYLQCFPCSSSVSGYQRKLQFCSKQMGLFFFFFGFSCCILFRERMTEKWLQRKNLLSLLRALKNAPPLRIQERVSHQTAGPNGTAKLMQS